MSYYLQEDGTSKFLLEDGGGFYLLEGASGPSITDTGVAITDSVVSLRTRSLADAGATVSDSLAAASPGHVTATDTGLTVSDSMQLLAARLLNDIGAAITDAIPKRTLVTDTGLAFSESLARTAFKARALVDTGLIVTDSAGAVAITDTGLTVSTSLASHRTRFLSATGLTLTDSMQEVARKVVSDVGLSLTDDLVARKNGGDVSVNITSVGLTLNSSLAKSARLFRVIPNSFAIPDQAVTIRDGIRSSSTPPTRPHHPHANFTDNVAGLTVTFTDTSTPGSSGPITAWFWTFGDGGTSTAQNPSHTYAGTGTYQVTLTVTGTSPDGLSSVAKYVTTFVPAATGFHIDAVLV